MLRLLYLGILFSPLYAWSTQTFFETRIESLASSVATQRQIQTIRLDPVRDDTGQLWVQGTFWTRVFSKQQPQANPSRYFTAMFPVRETKNLQLNRFTWNILGLGTFQNNPTQPTSLRMTLGTSISEYVYSQNVYGAYTGIVYPSGQGNRMLPEDKRFDQWPLSNEYGPWTAVNPNDGLRTVNFYFLQPKGAYQHKAKPTVLVQEVDSQGRTWENTATWSKKETLGGVELDINGYGMIHLVSPSEAVWKYNNATSEVFPLQRRLSHYASTQLHCSQPIDLQLKQVVQTDEWSHYYVFLDGSSWVIRQLHAHALKPDWRDMREQPDAWLEQRDRWKVSDQRLEEVAFEADGYQQKEVRWAHSDIMDSIALASQFRHMDVSRQDFLTFQQNQPATCRTGYRSPNKQGMAVSTEASRYQLPVRYEWAHGQEAPSFFPITSHTFR